MISESPDALEVQLEDRDLVVEVELLGEVMIAATEAAGPLSEQEIDRLLGLR